MQVEKHQVWWLYDDYDDVDYDDDDDDDVDEDDNYDMLLLIKFNFFRKLNISIQFSSLCGCNMSSYSQSLLSKTRIFDFLIKKNYIYCR